MVRKYRNTGTTISKQKSRPKEKETLYNNNITSLQEYIQLVEEWILFYNTTRLKSKIKKKRKTYAKREK